MSRVDSQKRVRDMTRTYSQMHRTDKYSQLSSVIWSVWPSGWVFVYELSGCEFESSCSHSIKFYVCYVDDTLLLVKRQDIDKILKSVNGFDKNLNLIVDKFENETPHFLDLEICPNGHAPPTPSHIRWTVH